MMLEEVGSVYEGFEVWGFSMTFCLLLGATEKIPAVNISYCNFSGHQKIDKYRRLR